MITFQQDASHTSTISRSGDLCLSPVTSNHPRRQQRHAQHPNQYVPPPPPNQKKTRNTNQLTPHPPALLTLVPTHTQTLSTAQNITLLAPSNTAFAALLARNPRSAELMTNPRALAGVLQYHVLAGRFVSGDFARAARFPATLLAAPFANVTGGQRVGLVVVEGEARVVSGFKQVAGVVTAVCMCGSCRDTLLVSGKLMVFAAAGYCL
jgi:uncharacterized surface protein with fasciclin (FAS1) repeats